MKAYKASYDEKCETLTYEVDKTYTFNGQLQLCSKGFHFCKELKDVFNHENCTSCHSIEPDGRPLDPAIYNGYSHTSANCSGQCHTDTLETANAEADDTLVWQKGNLWNGPADCDRMTSLPSFVSGGDPAENLKHHLQQDNLIIWAIMGGDVPFNNRTDNDEIMDVEAWRTLVGKWVDHWKDNDYSCTAAIQNLQ